MGLVGYTEEQIEIWMKLLLLRIYDGTFVPNEVDTFKELADFLDGLLIEGHAR